MSTNKYFYISNKKKLNIKQYYDILTIRGDKMKKSKIIISLLVAIIILTGCNKSINGQSRKITPIDSEIEYILFRNKKIYLTKNLEDFVLQFKGNECKMKAEGSNISDSFEIDNINSKDHAFYTLNGGYTFGVSCFTDGNISEAKFNGYLEQNDKNYVDREIKEWYINSLQEVIKIKTKNHGTLIFGDDNNHETIDSIKSKMGEPSSIKKDYRGKRIEKLVYNISNYELSFLVMNSQLVSQGTEVYGFYLEAK